ncbi:MAG: hemerythrin domain-containing protein [Salinivirgaceae bacterium]
METISLHHKAADLIYQKPGLILVLERLGIFLGVQDKTLEELCGEHNINPTVVLALCQMHIDDNYTPANHMHINDIQLIINYLTVSHTYYTEELYPLINESIQAMAEKSASPSIQMVKKFFMDYRSEADNHFDYENNTAFPYILALYKQTEEPSTGVNSEYSVETYRQHHDNIEEKLDDLKQLLIKYLPNSNCHQLRRNVILYLHRLDRDLKTHARIENDILIPLVKHLEEKLSQK